MDGMKTKLDRIRELCRHGELLTRTGVSIQVRDLFTKIETNADLLEDIINAHFKVYHAEAEVECPCGDESRENCTDCQDLPPWWFDNINSNPSMTKEEEK